MGYFQDIIDLMLLKDETYKKVGNDKTAFGKLFYAYFISAYIIMFIIGALILTGVRFFVPDIFSVIMNYNIIFLIVFLLLPFFVFLLTFILNLIPYVIGLLVGGKPNNYIDFFKVYMYHYPVIYPLVLFFNKVLGPIYCIWSFFILFKTYKIVHRLDNKKAGLAIAINIVLSLFVIFGMIVLIFSLAATYPEILESLE